MAKHRWGVASSGILDGQGGFLDQASHGGEVVEHISQEEESGHPGQPVDWQTFEPPVLESSVAPFHSIAAAMIDPFPGGRANREISGQTDGTIREMFGQVEDTAMGVGSALIRAIRRWILDYRELSLGVGVFQTGLLTNPFGALSLGVITIGGQTVPIGTDRTTVVIIAPQHPVLRILVA